jgi:hypothetical protein
MRRYRKARASAFASAGSARAGAKIRRRRAPASPLSSSARAPPDGLVRFGTLLTALAAGPWMAGVIHDATGSYRPAFLLAIGCCAVSAAAIWIAAPRKVRVVPGRVRHG